MDQVNQANQKALNGQKDAMKRHNETFSAIKDCIRIQGREPSDAQEQKPTPRK